MTMDIDLETDEAGTATAADGYTVTDDLKAEDVAKGFIAVGLTITGGLMVGAMLGKEAEPGPPKTRYLGDDSVPTLSPEQAMADADGDFLYDSVDPHPGNPDIDGDGILDGRDWDWSNPDVDADGIIDGKDPDFVQPDRDGDGLFDRYDLHPDNPDANNDGIPDGFPSLRHQEIGDQRGFYMPNDPSSYITPDNEVVQGFANNLEVRDYPAAINIGGNNISGIKFMRFADGKPLMGKYFFDAEHLGHTDYWQNPEHFLTTLGRGDCEDYALASNSLLEAKGYDSVVVLGTMKGEGHAWTETIIDGKAYLTDNNVRDLLIPRDVAYSQLGYSPQSMFGDDLPLGTYNPDWVEWE